MYKFIFSYKHSLGPYYNLIVTINSEEEVEYEYSYNSNFIYEPEKKEIIKDSLDKELSKQFIKYLKQAKIEDMDREYCRFEIMQDNAPDCSFALLDNSDSTYVYIEADSYPRTFKYVVKALDLINENFTYWYKIIEGEMN